MGEYKRNCSECQSEIVFKSFKNFQNSEVKNDLCRSCKAILKRKNIKIVKIRKCPNCKKDITYSSISAFNNGNNNNSRCKSCVTTGSKNPMFGRIGNKNPRFGKENNYDIWLTKYGKEVADEKMKTCVNKIKNYTYPESRKEEYRTKYSGKNSPRYGGDSNYKIWLKKYGKEVAEEKMGEYRKKQSINSSGENNPMFGKPSPNGSGNGYSGWFDKTYFRSLRELMFLIYAKRFNMDIENLEKKKYKIPYEDYTGKIRNYFGDFIVNGRYFVEIKPKKLQSSPKNISKKEAALVFCKENDLIFKYIDPPINNKLLKKHHKRGDIKFLPKYEIKFQEYNKSLDQ
jgi:hypothetical protein